MKTIGLLGGMSWESTATYYRILNERVAQRLGGLHSARCVLYSVDFGKIDEYQRTGDWARIGAILIAGAQAIERAGADLLVLCTNTMHKFADEISATLSIPMLHIADATAESIKAADMRCVGLLGTRFTMQEDFYRGRLRERHGLEVLVPEPAEQGEIHHVIMDELCSGQILEASRAAYRNVIDALAKRGCEGVILGCTEIGMLIAQSDSSVPLFDTTVIHAEAAVEAALAQ